MEKLNSPFEKVHFSNGLSLYSCSRSALLFNNNFKAKVLSTFAFLASDSVNSPYQIFCLYLGNTNPIKDEYKTVPQLVVMVCLGLILNIERAKNNKTKFFKNIIKKVVNKKTHLLSLII